MSEKKGIFSGLFGSKKHGGCCNMEIIEDTAACDCGCSTTGTVETIGTCCGEATDGICCVKVLGTGCKNCHSLLESAQAAVKALGLGIEVEYITDIQKIMEYGVMSTPALVVNDKVVSMRKSLKAAEIEKLLLALKS